MEKQASSEHFHANPSSHAESDPPEPVRTRWTPKPEQILILESIFNSGMVNPPKEETVRIRKLLEKFGAVRDANVFYWFQNRRSRSRRRQRQQQAASAGSAQRVGGCNSMFLANSSSSCSSSGSSNRSPSYCNYSSGAAVGAVTNPAGAVSCSSAVSSLNPSIQLRDDAGDDLFAISRQFGLLGSDQHNTNSACSSNLPQMHYQPTGTMTVFINGMAVELPRGPIDVRSMFGYDAMLVHSSGELLPVNEHGFLMKSLQMGESYFLVSRSV